MPPEPRHDGDGRGNGLTSGRSRVGFVLTPAPRKRGRVVQAGVRPDDTAGRRAPVVRGAVAQLGERCNRTAEVRGSTPLSSIDFSGNAGRRPVGRRVPMAVCTACPGTDETLQPVAGAFSSPGPSSVRWRGGWRGALRPRAGAPPTGRECRTGGSRPATPPAGESEPPDERERGVTRVTPRSGARPSGPHRRLVPTRSAMRVESTNARMALESPRQRRLTGQERLRLQSG